MSYLRVTAFLTFFLLAFAISASAQVTVSGSTGANGSYTELNLAFTAINGAGTQAGNNISVAISANTTEAASAVLNAGDWATLTVRPTAAATVQGTIVGAVIKINGADNVTIDGRIGGVGTARSLTVQNNSTATATAAIWLASVAAGNGASNNVIRNLEIAAGQTANTGTNTTIGVYIGGTTISLTATDGNDNDNNQIIFNRLIRARYGIATRGVTTNNNIAPIITDNIVGPSSFGGDSIGKAGIYMQADAGAIVSRNTVQYVGGDLANTTAGTDRCGICIGNENWGVTEATTITSGEYTVTRNIIHDVVEERTFSAVGIRLGTTRGGTATNNLVANNFIYNIRADGTLGDQACGIGYAAGHTDRIVFNSISMTGDMDPGTAAAASIYGNAMRVSTVNGANNVNLTMANNSVYLDVNSNTATVHFYPITLPAATYTFGTGSLNYNNYYFNPANPQLFTGGVGVTSGVTPGAEFLTLANWQAALTPPQDANSIQSNPLYFSNTLDLHLQPASPNINAGTVIAGITDDIDGQVRPNGANPDIGADEFYTSPGTIALSAAAQTASETIGTITVTVNRLAGANGAASVNYATGGGTATGGAACGAGVDYVSTSGTLNWADLDAAPKTFTVTICNDGVLEATENFNVTLSTATGATLGSPSVQVVTITDVGSTFNGTINVGTGETITSLTNPGGIFAAINNGTVTGNITINITSDLAGETGAVTLNEIAGGFTVTIKPSGAARTISGAAPAAGGLLGFNSTDNVTIDGSLSGGTDRSLTITPSNTANNGGGIYFASGTNGAQNNVIKNVKVYGNGSSTGVLLGITIAGTAFGGVGLDNDNNRIENNDIRGAYYGIASLGASAANKDTGLVITKNILSGTGTTGIGRVGIYVFSADGAQITENNIASVSNPGAVDTIGIAAGSQGLSNVPLATGTLSNALISRNYIGVVSNNSAQSAAGIVVASDVTGTNTVVNNMITGVTGNADTPDIVAGIYVNGLAGSTQNIFHNSVSMTGDRLPVTANMFPSYALAIATDQPTNVRDNVLVNSQTRTGSTGTGGESYAIGFDGPAANVNLLSNNNDLFVSGPLGQIGITGDLTTAAQTPAGTGTNQTTLAAWQAATGEDAASISIDPLFVSATDLHIPVGSPLVNAGADVGITVDFDGQTRDAMRDIGADEFVAAVPGTLQFSAATFSVGEAGPTATLTVSRTGGSDGAVAVNYTLANGTATGGAACGGTVDFVNTGGTVNFANAETSKTFTVAICNDTLDEANETFTSTLSGATGGATIGSQATATVTITDDDPTPSLSINDVALAEGNAGTTTFAFTVSLSAASGQTVTVNYATADGTATAPSDYAAIASTLLTFAPGETTKTVNVLVNGDTTNEANETFFVNLSGATNATISDTQGQGTINNDDSVGGLAFRVNDVRVVEGNSGTVNAVFTVTLAAPSFEELGSTYTVQYATANGTATAGSDYTTASGTLTFTAAGTQTVTVLVTGDTNKEANEFFFVNLTNPTGGATISDNQGAGIIVDDDRPYVADFDRDLKADYSVFRPSTLDWFVLRSSNSSVQIGSAGPSNGVPVPGDYDGDGKVDFAVFQASSGVWTVLRSSNNSLQTSFWGIPGDKPVQGDYDGDGKTDLAVFRPSTGTWWVLRSSNGSSFAFAFGISTDLPVQGDYDGDAKTDIAVYRAGTWYVFRSSDSAVSINNWGNATDKPVSGDFDGDGRNDLAIYRSGVWWIVNSLSGTSSVVSFGLATDIPSPADFDGDGSTDIAVYRGSSGNWFVLQSSNQAITGVKWGTTGDVPVPSAYIPQ